MARQPSPPQPAPRTYSYRPCRARDESASLLLHGHISKQGCQHYKHIRYFSFKNFSNINPFGYEVRNLCRICISSEGKCLNFYGAFVQCVTNIIKSIWIFSLIVASLISGSDNVVRRPSLSNRFEVANGQTHLWFSFVCTTIWHLWLEFDFCS